MSDARLSLALPSHPKTKKLIRRLGDGAAWRLVCLILWTAANRPDGDLGGMTAEDVELAADWSGELGTFTDALLAVGFLDETEGGYEMHDWSEHQPWVMGSEQRSYKARWNAIKRHHGEAEADRQVPEYASTRRNDAASNAGSKEGSKKSSASSNAPSPSPSPSPRATEPSGSVWAEPQAAQPPAITLPLNTGSEFPITTDQVREFSDLYPATDVMAELRKMRGWLIANPANRKTKTGVLRFVTRWLGKEQDKGAPANARAGPNGQQPGKQMQGLMALEGLKSGNRLDSGRDRNGLAEALPAIAGPNARR